jgi:hypothetical protein
MLSAPSDAFPGKAATWLIEGETGDLLAEFYGPEGSGKGLCSYKGGKFPTKNDCTITEFFEKASQMWPAPELEGEAWYADRLAGPSGGWQVMTRWRVDYIGKKGSHLGGEQGD